MVNSRADNAANADARADNAAAYRDFTGRLKLLASKNPSLIMMALSNIFTMRLIGNKTHGDLAEIAIAEFINQYMYDFRSVHVGKDLYRAKTKEEDITVINEMTAAEFPVSLKAYNDGPLQLSTDKGFNMFPRLEQGGAEVLETEAAQRVLADPAFAAFQEINVLPLIYDERQQRCNILVFDNRRAIQETERIVRIDPPAGGGRRKHPIYQFLNAAGGYICEVRYGGPTANPLQRGLWTHTRNALPYFDSITGGWIDYSPNHLLVDLFSHALISSDAGHRAALEQVREDIAALKRRSGM